MKFFGDINFQKFAVFCANETVLPQNYRWVIFEGKLLIVLTQFEFKKHEVMDTVFSSFCTHFMQLNLVSLLILS